jgi:diguanylate cyclase (GGDEF)-like protein
MSAKDSSPARGARDSSTDSVDLGAALEGSRTQSYDAHALAPLDAGRAARDEGEADIILIAHPDGQKLGTRYRLAPGTSTEIGRSSAADISFPEVPSISRVHARLRHGGREVVIQDLQSLNGTSVNDQPVRGQTVLRSGDRFQVGEVHFKFVREQDIEHAYHEAIHQLVMRDGLTQIFNRRKYDEEAQREVARAVRHRRPLSLIMCDIDRFKQVNDNHGHLCGDSILKQIAQLTLQFLRPEQIFARVGGEEFAILSTEVDLEGARALAEKVRARLAEHEFVFAGSKVPITCSFGVCELTPEMTTPEELYAAADRALYLAKNGGRNRVEAVPAGPAAGS